MVGSTGRGGRLGCSPEGAGDADLVCISSAILHRSGRRKKDDPSSLREIGPCRELAEAVLDNGLARCQVIKAKFAVHIRRRGKIVSENTVRRILSQRVERDVRQVRIPRKRHTDQYAARDLETSNGPQDPARKSPAKSFGFMSRPQRSPDRPRSSSSPPSIPWRGGPAPILFGTRPLEAAQDRRSRDSFSGCSPKSADSVQASLPLKRIANLYQVLFAIERFAAEIDLQPWSD